MSRSLILIILSTILILLAGVFILGGLLPGYFTITERRTSPATLSPVVQKGTADTPLSCPDGFRRYEVHSRQR